VVPMQLFVQWVMVISFIALLLSMLNRWWLPPLHQPYVQGAIMLGGFISIILFPVYAYHPIEFEQLFAGSIFIGGLGITIRNTALTDKLRAFPQHITRWFRQRGKPTSPSHPGKEEKTIPGTASEVDSPQKLLRVLESACQQLPDGQVPSEVRLEISWLYLEEGGFEQAQEQARLALAENASSTRAQTGRLRRWLRYLHCYQAILAEQAYHVHKERTRAQIARLAWERYENREKFWRD